MISRSWIARVRRQRLAIGLIAAYALLVSALLPAFASVADPLEAVLAAHLCGPGGAAPNDNAPAGPSERHKCQLCGPSCAMGGHAPVAALSNGVISIAAFAALVEAPRRPDTTAHSSLSLYPSDAVSQGPPSAA